MGRGAAGEDAGELLDAGALEDPFVADPALAVPSWDGEGGAAGDGEGDGEGMVGASATLAMGGVAMAVVAIGSVTLARRCCQNRHPATATMTKHTATLASTIRFILAARSGVTVGRGAALGGRSDRMTGLAANQVGAVENVNGSAASVGVGREPETSASSDS